DTVCNACAYPFALLLDCLRHRALAASERNFLMPRSLRYSSCIRFWYNRLSGPGRKQESTERRHSAQSWGDMRAQRASTASSFGMLPGGVSCQALHSNRMYAPTAAVDMASTFPS